MTALATDATVGVVGAGTMGSGIAQVALVAGHSVLLFDLADSAAENAAASIGSRLDRLVQKGRLDAEAATAARQRLHPVQSLEDFAPCRLVVEAAAEDLEVKREVFALLEEICDEQVILATNTSTLSVTAIASRLTRPERVCGMHFFNPAPVMKLVEVPSGALTDPDVAGTVADTAAAWGKTPVRCASTPGFVVNRVARPFYGEALRVLEEQGADCATIDAVLREAGGFPMGPFELADLVGNDVNLAVGRSVWEQTFGDPRYAPTVAQQSLVDAGRLGRKTGRGWFEYDQTGAQRTGDQQGPRTEDRQQPPEQVVYHGGFHTTYGLLDRIAAAGVSVELHHTGPARRPSGSGTSAYGIELPTGGLVLEATGEPATTDGDAITLDWVFDATTATRVCLAPGDASEPESLRLAIGLFQAAGLQVSVIDDVPGLIVARTVAMLINEAVELVTRAEAAPADVETAMRLGTGYPIGLLEWGDRIGPDIVQGMLKQLSSVYPDGRYRPAPLLTRCSDSNRPLRTLGTDPAIGGSMSGDPTAVDSTAVDSTAVDSTAVDSTAGQADS